MYRSNALCALVSLLLSFQFSGNAQNYTISTIAGTPSNFAQGGPATNARFGIVSAVAEGPDGSIYVADAAYHQVFRVGPNGHVSLLAGCRTRGYSGDSGPATSAMLDTPTALAVDTGGDVFIGDSGNHRVREVTPYGNIQTVAGNGQLAPSPALSPVLPGEGGPATAAPLNQIAGLTFASSGDLVISDIGNGRIFHVSQDGNIHTIAGNATTPASMANQPAIRATLSGPTGVAADWYGNIFFAEQQTGVVRKIDVNGNMSVMIGAASPTGVPAANGSPLSYPLLSPMALACDGFHVYIADTGRISMYTLPIGRSERIQTIAGNALPNSGWTGDGGPALAAGMNPTSIAASPNDSAVYFADSLLTLDFRNRVRRVSNQVVTAFAGGNLPTGSGDNGPATSAQLYFPQALAIDPAGNIDVADTFDNRVRVVGPDGNIKTVAGTGIAVPAGSSGPALAANLNSPQGLATDSNGDLYVFDGFSVQRLVPSGTINTVAALANQDPPAPASTGFPMPAGSLAVDGNNNVYVADLASVRKISSSTGAISTIAGTGTAGDSGVNGPAAAAQIGNLAGIALDATGNLYIADGDNNLVRKVDGAGNITAFAGGGTSLADGVAATDVALNMPIAVAADPTGNVYIAEYGANRIRVVKTDGTIHTIAGNGLEGFSGDGGLATNAALNGPTDVKLDAQGNVYIADSLNSVIRKLTAVSATPLPAIVTVINSASLTGGPVAPGERVSLTGSALGPNSQVFFNNVAAPVISSTFSSAQVVVPYEVSGLATVPVTVSTEGATSAPFAVQIASSAPGVFTRSGNGQGRAVALDSNGLPNTPANSAQPGSILAVLCTGDGLISPSVATGVPIPATTPSPVLPVTATIDGFPATVYQAYSIPDTIGQFVVDILVPDGVSTDDKAPVVIMVGNATTQASATVAISSGGDPSPDVIVKPDLKWYGVGKHGGTVPGGVLK